MSFYDRLEYICSLRGTTVSALCAKCKVASSTATNWKQKQIAPNGNIVIKFAKELDVSTNFLLLGEDKSSILSSDEEELLTLFRLLADDNKKRNAINEVKRLVSGTNIDFYEDKVSAGEGFNLASSSIIQLRVYHNKMSMEADFAVQVKGESMSPEYHDGDILLIKDIEHTHEPDVGQNGIFVINDSHTLNLLLFR